MSSINALAHLLIPRHSNNFKAKVLHVEYLFIFALILFAFQLGLASAPATNMGILGYAANISPDKVIELTNLKRLAAGVGTVTRNPLLEEAAKKKGLHMLEQNYWAHIAPDGTEPWDFFSDVGYTYRYAGENLARDFSNPDAAIEAWMASPTHRENMLAAKYDEIGIAVVEGDLNGVDTTIIVQLFGTKPGATVATLPAVSSETNISTPPITANISPNVQAELIASSNQSVIVSPLSITKVISIGVITILGASLAIDLIIISKRNVSRVSSKPFAHISFLSMILILALLARAGKIL